MVARLVLRPDLDGFVAARLVPGEVDRLATAVMLSAQVRAPAGKVWITMRDERVRLTHVETDGQTIPDNLRYRLRKGERGNDVDDEIREAGHEFARAPRDPSLSIGNRINCRCSSVPLPGAVGMTIRKDPAPNIQGTRVSQEVYTRFPRAAESENGTSQDRPARFMGGAIDEVALMLRAQGRARRT
jgi:hypothetical protein